MFWCRISVDTDILMHFTGLDIAVQSMKLNEKSQFLIQPHLAYGTYGCLERIPPNSVILFEIELLEIIESSAAENYIQLPEEQKKQFSEVYKFCLSQCAKGCYFSLVLLRDLHFSFYRQRFI